TAAARGILEQTDGRLEAGDALVLLGTDAALRTELLRQMTPAPADVLGDGPDGEALREPGQGPAHLGPGTGYAVAGQPGEQGALGEPDPVGRLTGAVEPLRERSQLRARAGRARQLVELGELPAHRRSGHPEQGSRPRRREHQL